MFLCAKSFFVVEEMGIFFLSNCVPAETCLFLVFVQFDKFSSIRIPGSKKDRPALPSFKQAHCSSSECTTPAEMDDFLPAHLSDQEILALFEKMMVRIADLFLHSIRNS